MKKIILLFVIISPIVCNAQIINFPDINLKNKLLTNGIACIGESMDNCIFGGSIDSNNNGEIEVSEAEAVAMLYVNSTGTQITDLTGIEYFINLEYLDCTNNNLTTINLSQNISLKHLNCNENDLISLSLDGLIDLEILACRNNQLTSLDISEQTQLKLLICEGNQINSLGFSNNPALQRVYCGNNLLTTLDLGANPQLFDLGCRNNPNLASINIKNGMTQVFGAGTLYNQCWNNLPNLNYICADDNEITALQSFLAGCGVTQSIAIDSACPLSVNEYELASFVIAPNPSNALFELTFNDYLTEDTNYAVYDMVGKKLLEKTIKKETKGSYINLENFSPGIYLLQVNTRNKTINKTLIKK